MLFIRCFGYSELIEHIRKADITYFEEFPASGCYKRVADIYPAPVAPFTTTWWLPRIYLQVASFVIKPLSSLLSFCIINHTSVCDLLYTEEDIRNEFGGHIIVSSGQFGRFR